MTGCRASPYAAVVGVPSAASAVLERQHLEFGRRVAHRQIILPVPSVSHGRSSRLSKADEIGWHQPGALVRNW